MANIRNNSTAPSGVDVVDADCCNTTAAEKGDRKKIGKKAIRQVDKGGDLAVCFAHRYSV